MNAPRHFFCLTILLSTISHNVFCAADDKSALTKLGHKLAKACTPKPSAHKIVNAISSGDFEETQRLLDEKPARVNAQWQITKWTPLMEAVSRNFCDSFPSRLEQRLAFVQLLLERGADANATIKNTVRTPLLIATNDPRGPEGMPIEVIQLLVNHGATIDIQGTIKKFTPLMYAARNNRQDIVSYLLEHGANPTLQTDTHKTAADLAREEGHEELAKFIEEYHTEE